jgi:hypothetical protein
VLKCNVDAAIFKEQNCFGAGMCLRDDKKNFIQAWNHDNPLHKKQMRGGIDDISDKLNLRTKFGAILFACKTCLSSLPNFSISFIKRQVNNIAHLLVRAALSFVSYQ